MSSDSPIAAAPRVRIALVDDHVLFRAGLKLLIAQTPDWIVVGEATTADQAFAMVAEHEPELALLDIHLPDGNGIALARALREAAPNLKVIMLSSDATPTLVHEAIVAGVRGYVLKASASDELIRAIEAVLAGRTYFCAEVSSAVMDNYRQQFVGGGTSDKPRLTARETEMLRLIAGGKRNKDIADALGITPKSAETYRLRLMKKLGIDSAAGLTRFAIREGIVQL